MATGGGGVGPADLAALEAAFAVTAPEPAAMSMDDVRRIILAFYSPSVSSGLRRKLDRWLEKYQNRPEAWAMADRFLSADLAAGAAAPTAEHQQLMLFAAMTMHHKIRYDFLELPQESLSSLRETLLRHVARLVNGGAVRDGMGPVLGRLCLGFSSLVVQTHSVGGEEAVRTVVGLFPPPGGTLPLLEILTTLAEEASSRRTPIGDRRREAFLAGLRASAPAVLGLLQQVLAAGAAGGHVAWLERVFKCFTAWVSACGLPPELVAGCPLFGNVFEALLRFPALFNTACDAIRELLRVYTR